MKFVGVDACRKGWFAVAFDQELNWEIGIFSNIDNLWKHYHTVTLLLIDIPIGLPHLRNRQCDSVARKILKNRASSIFPAPSRVAIRAQNYIQACEINEEILEKKLSRQTWNISPKIKAVDALMRENSQARRHIRESHPEICFWALNGGHPMRHRKKESQGVQERLDVLQLICPESKHIFKAALAKYKRKDLAPDDILDAIALALTASSPLETIQSIPENPERDEHGLPMEIVYTNLKLPCTETAERE